MDSVPETLPYGLRLKLLGSFFIIIISLAGLNGYTLIRITSQDRVLSKRVDHQIELHSIHSSLQVMNSHISNYIRSGNDEYIISYRQEFAAVTKRLGVLGLIADEKKMKNSLRDLTAMIETYRERASALINLYNDGAETIYVWESELDLLNLSGYIREELEELNSLFLDNLQSFFLTFKMQMSRSLKINISFVILMILFCYVLAWNFSISVSKPIHQLALELIRFGKETEHVDLIVPQRKDEIAVLFRSFNEMSKHITGQIEEIQEKAELEQRLKDREIQHHQTEHLLKESELALLQSQINPHFLFNTLNIIDSLSSLEEAPRTGKMIRSLSELLRYNLVMQKRAVPLEEEIELINSYIHIQKTRFGEKLTYSEEIDPEVLMTTVPALILQPLIENAIKHGLEPISRPGLISLKAVKRENEILIEIIDNGCGITAERIDEIMDTDFETKSMGIRNVIRRLELKYGKPCLSLSASDNSGTICRILIPA